LENNGSKEKKMIVSTPPPAGWKKPEKMLAKRERTCYDTHSCYVLILKSGFLPTLFCEDWGLEYEQADG